MKAVMNLAIGLAFVLILAICVFPAPYGNSKESAKRTACLSNLKQQALGLLLYADDSSGRFPLRDTWMDATSSYRKKALVNVSGEPRGKEWAVHCPSVPKGAYGYAFNGALSGAKIPKDPVATPLVYESVNPIRNASDLVTSLPAPGRHKGKDNVGYADGHAKPLVVQ